MGAARRKMTMTGHWEVLHVAPRRLLGRPPLEE